MALVECEEGILGQRQIFVDEECNECCSSACGSAQCCDDDACSEVSIIDCACPSQRGQQQSNDSCCNSDIRCCSEVSDCEQECLRCEDTSCQDDDLDYVCCTTASTLPQTSTTFGSQPYDTLYGTNGFHFEDFSIPDLPTLARSSSSASLGQDSSNFSSHTSATAMLTSSSVSMTSSCAEVPEPYHCVSCHARTPDLIADS